MKILAIHPIINPMRVYLFNEMHDYYISKGYDFEVLFLSVSDKNRHWENNYDMKFKYNILKNFAIRTGRKDLFTFFINPQIHPFLNKTNPDIIICCQWDHYSAYASNYWTRKNSKKFIFFAESTINERSWRRIVFSPLVNYLIKRIEIFWAGGTRAKEYLIHLGVPSEKINIFYNSIDINYFSEKSENFSTEEKNKLRNKLGIKTDRIILFSGQLIERKGVFELLEGFLNYSKNDVNTSLLMIGKGQEKEKMEKIIKIKNISNIFFGDFVQYKDLYKYYSISDLFILPSREEVWGLVLNEAAACGLPIITTTATGAGIDLVEEGKNGYIIKPNCPKCITEAIKKVFENNLHNHNNSIAIVQKTRISEMLKRIKI